MKKKQIKDSLIDNQKLSQQYIHKNHSSIEFLNTLNIQIGPETEVKPTEETRSRLLSSNTNLGSYQSIRLKKHFYIERML